VPVSEIVASAGAMIEVQAARKGLSFEATAGADCVQVHADRERMTQILTNLLTNAVKFTDAGSVTVGWRADDRAVRIDVRDTGRGIPATGWLPSSSRSCRPDAARRSSSRASGWGSPSAASWRARWEGI
jgi:signal transduction histidine kinase